jgi:hypothetical protein
VESKKLLFVFSGKNDYGFLSIVVHDALGGEYREHSRLPWNYFFLKRQ